MVEHDKHPMNVDEEILHYYLIPGMGADHRLFTNFELKYGIIHHLDWIPHEGSRNLSEYAALMSERVTTKNNILIGSSMGGMTAVEMSRIIKPLSTILVSAPTGRHEFPRVLKFVDSIRLHRALNAKQVSAISGLADTFMGFKTPEQKQLFYDMLKKNGPEFLHFSVAAILGWKNTAPPEGDYIQIIGSLDKLFSPKKIQTPYVIEGGGHFTAFEKGPEVSEIINKYIEQNILPNLKRI